RATSGFGLAHTRRRTGTELEPDSDDDKFTVHCPPCAGRSLPASLRAAAHRERQFNARNGKCPLASPPFWSASMSHRLIRRPLHLHLVRPTGEQTGLALRNNDGRRSEFMQYQYHALDHPQRIIYTAPTPSSHSRKLSAEMPRLITFTETLCDKQRVEMFPICFLALKALMDGPETPSRSIPPVFIFRDTFPRTQGLIRWYWYRIELEQSIES
ncbi:hypothetical protein L249_4038, partial [Ophiocordyceps polyrhachis-furcata BCC 54312]